MRHPDDPVEDMAETSVPMKVENRQFQREDVTADSLHLLVAFNDHRDVTRHWLTLARTCRFDVITLRVTSFSLSFFVPRYQCVTPRIVQHLQFVAIRHHLNYDKQNIHSVKRLQ